MSARRPTSSEACEFAPLRHEIAAEVVVRQLEANPGLMQRYGAAGRERCEQDARYHLVYLAEAVAAGSPALFENYVSWVRSLLESLGVPSDDLARQFELLAVVLRERAGGPDFALGAKYLQSAQRSLGQLSEQHASSLVAGEQAQLIQELLDALLACRRDLAQEIVDAALARGVSVRTLYLEVFQPLLREIGRLWQLNRVTVAQEHFCTAAIQLLMGQLSLHVFGTERIGRSMLTACVGDELHEVGARMVADFFEMAGWDTHFLGANVPTGALLEMASDLRIDVLCLSVTLTGHLSSARNIIAAIRGRKGLEHVKIIVGGMPFNVEQGLWDRIGAHGCAQDAKGAVDLAARLVGP